MLLAPLIILIAALSAWLIHKWTVYALPWLVGWYAAGFAFGTGAGWLGSFLVWGLTALFVFCLMRWLHGVAGDAVVRALLSLVYVGPAVAMGYLIFEDLSVGQIPPEVWRQGLCLVEAGGVGVLALGRLAGVRSELSWASPAFAGRALVLRTEP